MLARFRIENAPSLKYAEARGALRSSRKSLRGRGQARALRRRLRQMRRHVCKVSRGATAEAVEYHVRCGELRRPMILTEQEIIMRRPATSAATSVAGRPPRSCDIASLASRLATRKMMKKAGRSASLLLRSAADMYGAAARRLHDETKAAKMRLCKLEAAAIEALQLKLYSRAADAFEAVATEVVQDNLTAANATRLFFKSALCSLVGGEHDLMRGKVEIFAKRDPVFGASPEKLFLVDANRCATAEGLPDYDTFADAAYNFCTVRSLDAWDLSMLKVLNDDMRVKYDAYWSRVKRRAAREKRRAQKRKEEEERQARMKRDEARWQEEGQGGREEGQGGRVPLACRLCASAASAASRAIEQTLSVADPSAGARRASRCRRVIGRTLFGIV